MGSTTSLTPVEYEILFALFQLKHKGFSEVVLKEVCQEVNQRRKQEGIHSLSVQHVYYYLRKLSHRPFVKRRNEKHVSRYSLVKGTFKLIQSPPLCIHINDADFALICDRVARCNKEPSIKCVEYLVNRGTLKLPPHA
jgi:uncharacterized protein YceH (UPF0502 family)